MADSISRRVKYVFYECFVFLSERRAYESLEILKCFKFEEVLGRLRAEKNPSVSACLRSAL